MASGTLSKEKVSCVARPYRAEGSCPRHEPVAMSVQDVLDRIASDFVPKVAAPPIVPAAYALPAQRLFELTAEVIDAVMEDSREAMLRDLREADLQHLPFDDLVPKFPARETSISIDNHEIGGNMTCTRCGSSEICDLRWEQVDFRTATVHVGRVKSGTPATINLTGRR